MDARLLHHYNNELKFMQEMGGEFARTFPKIAGRLGLEGLDCADPYVERLLEGFAFLTARGVSIGISLDAPSAAVADRTRRNWKGQGAFRKVVDAMERLKGYPHWSVICTISSRNMRHLTKLVDFFHAHEVPTCLMNILLDITSAFEVPKAGLRDSAQSGSPGPDPSDHPTSQLYI